MNVHDSEIIFGILKNAGYVQVDEINNANIVILNTCAIRNHAEAKVYSMLGALAIKKHKKGRVLRKIVVCGCLAQSNKKKILSRFPEVDIVIGTKNIKDLPELLKNEERVSLTSGKEYFDPDVSIIQRESPYKAWVSIIKGCENFCSYCIVPYVRGKEASRPKKEILEEIKKLSQSGVKEICLLGQNVNSYGNDLNLKYSFVDLLHDIDKLGCMGRVNFVTSHPKDVSSDLFYAMRDLPSLCKYLHFPCQSGSNKILDLMNRKYTKEKYMELVYTAREIVPEITIGTDIIVGFPQETERDFRETFDLMTEIEFDMGFIFKYSKRNGTLAEKMKGHIDEAVKRERHKILLDLQNEHIMFANARDVGKRVEVLIDGRSKTDENKLQGRSRTNKMVILENAKNVKEGDIVKLTITRASNYAIYG